MLFLLMFCFVFHFISIYIYIILAFDQEFKTLLEDREKGNININKWK